MIPRTGLLPDARQRIAEQTKHIRNRQDRAVARFNLWAKEPVK